MSNYDEDKKPLNELEKRFEDIKNEARRETITARNASYDIGRPHFNVEWTWRMELKLLDAVMKLEKEVASLKAKVR